MSLKLISVCDAKYVWLDEPARDEKWVVVVNLRRSDGSELTLREFPPHQRDIAREYAAAVEGAIRTWLAAPAKTEEEGV